MKKSKKEKNSAIKAPIWYNVNNEKNKMHKGDYCAMYNYNTLNSNLKRGIQNFSEIFLKNFKNFKKS